LTIPYNAQDGFSNFEFGENAKREKYNGQFTDKKENQTFLIFKEIQNGAVAKSYMTNGHLIYSIWGNICAFPHILGSPFLIYDFATAPL
jgi:hypothetical protein